jgi:inosine/xanthosine triphosphate pyrophosphatase family protein
MDGPVDKLTGHAELEPEQKAEVSHRGRALREFARRLPGVLREV